MCGEGPHLIGPMAEGLAGQVGGEAVEDEVTAGGARRHAGVVSVEGDAGHLLLMVLREKERKRERKREREREREREKRSPPTHN